MKYRFKYLIFLFIILSFLGGILEISYMLLIEHRFVIGGFFHAPIRPIYGFGGLLLFFMPAVLKKSNFLIFMSSFVICSIFEYLTSYLLEIIFNKIIWNYSNFFFNINGRICLLHSIIWGVLGVLFIKVIQPKIYRLYCSIKIKDNYINSRVE